MPKFVNQLPNADNVVGDNFTKSLNKVLKAVVRGTRVILREAATLQVGAASVNWRQTTITNFYKPVDRHVAKRRRVDWSDANSCNDSKNNKIKKKNSKIVPAIHLKNKNLRLEQVFSCVDAGGKIYWEFKAG